MDHCCPDSHHFPSDALKSESCKDEQHLITGGRFSGPKSSTQNSSHEFDRNRPMKWKSDLSFLPLKLEILEGDRTPSCKPTNAGATSPNGIHRCQPCGIIFSNPCTLEAHQQYYCSHRCRTEPQNYVMSEQKSSSSEDADISEKVPNTTRDSFLVEGRNQKILQRAPRTYYCSHCSYKSNKKISVNRHMRMHTCVIKHLLTSAVNSGGGSPLILKNYCPECNIRFHSYENFRRHLEQYCRYHCKEEDELPSSHLFVSIPSSPPLVIPYSLFKKSVLISPTMLPPTFNVLNSDGHFYFPSSHPTRNEDAKKHRPESRTSPNTNEPLDLSLKNPRGAVETSFCSSGDATMKDAEIRVDGDTASPIISTSKLDKVQKAEAFPAAATKDQSGFNQLLAGNDVLVKENAAKHSPNALHRADSVSICLRKFEHHSHQKDDKFTSVPHYLQSDEKMPAQIRESQLDQNCYCKECNIVFHKRENYAVHKKHYCSSKVSTDPMKVSVRETATLKRESAVAGVNKTSQASFFECSTCRIKFQSVENLRAHQTYYCFQHPKLIRADAQHCPNCRRSVPNGLKSLCEEADSACHLEFKCPECDFPVSPADASPKHKECPQSFQCKICGYKGNTLRGMRTHIRIHFDNRLPNAKEESCIVSVQPHDPHLGVTTVIKSLNHSEQAEQQDSFKTYRCDLCNYSSIYKGNVLRHQKCVHFDPDKPDDGKFCRASDDNVMRNSFHLNIANFLVHRNHSLDIMKREKLIDSSVLNTVRGSPFEKYTLNIAT